MGIFIRQDARAGDSALRTLVTGDDISRIENSSAVVKLRQGDLVKIGGLYSNESSSKFLATTRGRRAQTARTSSPRQIVFTFVSGDPTGVEQASLKNFFTYDRRIVFYDSRAKVSAISFFVVSVDDDFFTGTDTLTVTAQAEFDDLMNAREQTLFSADAQSSFPAISVSYTNATAVDASIRLRIFSASGAVVPVGAASITMKSSSSSGFAGGEITAVTGDYAGFRYTEQEFALDSMDEIVAGHGYIDPLKKSRFFIIRPGVTTTITVSSTAMPISGGNIRLLAFQTAPRGMYAPDFSIGASSNDD